LTHPLRCGKIGAARETIVLTLHFCTSAQGTIVLTLHFSTLAQESVLEWSVKLPPNEKANLNDNDSHSAARSAVFMIPQCGSAPNEKILI
jgi:hypothetical protein